MYINVYKGSTSALMICLKYVILLSLDNAFKLIVEIFSNTLAVEWTDDFFWTAEIAYEKKHPSTRNVKIRYSLQRLVSKINLDNQSSAIEYCLAP